MKKHMVWLLAFSVLAVSGNLMGQKENKVEMSLAGGAIFTGGNGAPFGGISIGFLTKYFGAELNGGYLSYAGIFGANLVIGLLAEKRVVPYTLGGVWTTTYGGMGFYAGGGLKLMTPARTNALRIEYRRYFIDGLNWGLNTVIAGVSFFF